MIAINRFSNTIIETLNLIAPGLESLADDFFLIGASALILSGIDIEKTPDLDILTSTSDALYLRSLWSDNIDPDFTPTHSDRFLSEFTRYNFQPMAVEVMGDLQVNTPSSGWQKLTVNQYDIVFTGKFNVKIPTLTEQIRILQLFNRDKDWERIALIKSIF